MAANYATEVKLFGRWSFEDVECKDISLEDYIACKPKYAQSLLSSLADAYDASFFLRTKTALQNKGAIQN